MIACGKSGDDTGTAKSRSGCVQRARQTDWTVLVHGLCSAIIALTTLQILSALAACLVSVCFLQSPVLGTLSCGLFRFIGLRGRSSAKANGGNIGIGHGGRPGSRRSPLAPQAPSMSDDDVLPSLQLLMAVMRDNQYSIVIRPKRSRRSSLRCRDTVSSKATVTTVTACDNIITKIAETVSSFRADNDVVHCSQCLVYATKEQ